MGHLEAAATGAEQEKDSEIDLRSSTICQSLLWFGPTALPTQSLNRVKEAKLLRYCPLVRAAAIPAPTAALFLTSLMFSASEAPSVIS